MGVAGGDPGYPVRGLVSTPCRGGTFDCLCGVLVNTWSLLLEASFKGDLGGVELDCGTVSRVTLLWRCWREGDVWLVGSLFSWREKKFFFNLLQAAQLPCAATSLSKATNYSVFFPVKALVGTSRHCKLPTNLGSLGGTLWKLGCFLFHHRQQAYEKVPVARNSTNENAFSLI